MTKLFFARLIQTALVLLIITLLTFGLLAAAGGDALTALSNDPKVSAETVAELRQVYGLDQPVVVRYVRWTGAALQGNFGRSFYFQLPVQQILWPRFWRTAALAFAALALASAIALSLGIAAAKRPGKWADRLCSALVLLGSSTPRLVLALIVLAFAVQVKGVNLIGPTASPASLAAQGLAAQGLAAQGLAAQGLTAQGQTLSGRGVLEWLLRLLPAALVMSVPLTALFLAQVRACVTAGLSAEFVRVARAKGLSERMILLRHVLRPALNPLLTVFGYSLGGVMSGSVIVEKILGWPGLGELSVTAVLSRDVPLLLGVVLITATAVLIGNLLADILIRLTDPRL